MNTNLTPELKAKFEAIIKEQHPTRTKPLEGLFDGDNVLDLMLQAYELDRWVDEAVRIPKTNDKVLITDGVIIKTAFFDTYRGRWQISGFKIAVSHWQPLPKLLTK